MPFTSGNFYLTMAQMKENALYFYSLCNQVFPDWTLNAIAGMLGNAQTESTLNPGIWEKLTVNSNKGYGFFQWTPGKNYLNWCKSEGFDPAHMNSVALRLDYELTERIQYYPTKQYPLTFNEFLHSVESPEYLASAWLYNYERPEIMPQLNREKQARFWFQFLSGEEPEPIPPEPTPNNNRFWWIYYASRKRC